MHIYFSETDSISSVLTDEAFLVFVRGHHPEAPSETEIEKSIEKMTPEERKLIIALTQSVASYAKAVEKMAIKFS
jgi:hypothetical protein